MACAILTLEQQSLPSLPHLRSVNPHVASSMEASKGTGTSFQTSFPRQDTALSSTDGEGRASSGVSSFAFQACDCVHVLKPACPAQHATHARQGSILC